MQNKYFPQSARPVSPTQFGMGWESKVILSTPKKYRDRDFIFLLGKMRYEPDKMTSEDIWAFQEYFEWLLENSSNRQHNRFKKVFGMLLHLKQFLKYLMTGWSKNSKIPDKLFWRFPGIYSGLLLDAYQYFGLKGSEYRNLIPSVRVIRYKPTKPSQRYIGVGYRDKGTKGKDYLDGTPSLEEFYCHRPSGWTNLSYSLDDPPELGVGSREVILI